MKCTHDAAEMDVASVADGMCPLCLMAQVRILRSALRAIDDIAVAKKRGAAVEMQAIARLALNDHLELGRSLADATVAM